MRKGEDFGYFSMTSGNPIRISTIVEGADYAECTMKDEDFSFDEDEFEQKNLEDVDFGLENSQLDAEMKREVREDKEKRKRWNRVMR